MRARSAITAVVQRRSLVVAGLPRKSQLYLSGCKLLQRLRAPVILVLACGALALEDAEEIRDDIGRIRCLCPRSWTATLGG
jgi:hypothetical protein